MESSCSGGIPPSIARYAVVERIGHGALGDVYKAIDREMERPVAIKVLRAPTASLPEARERFLHEARITGQVTHPNVVAVFDLGDDQGRPYLVMELLDGLPLVEHLRRGNAPTLDARMDLMLQICDGLQAAHDRGIVHRDIKPGNVVVQVDGVVKILDFGISSTMASTTVGAFSGTPEYASPEQVMGRRADPRSDIFSAASLFYFILSGRSPFVRADVRDTLDAVMHAQPPALSGADAPAPLARAVMKALEKNPAERHQSVAHLRAEIDQVRRGQEADRHRVARAALDRYRLIESLVDERRELGRRLRLIEVERESDAVSARLSARFPDFARADLDADLFAPIAADRVADDLTELQEWHNEQLAAVSVLRAACGEGTEPADSLQGRVASLLDKIRGDSGIGRIPK